EAARECRRKKKEYVRCLERQVTILQNQNHQLIEELQKMKALCAGALLDPSGQPPQLQGAPNLANSRHLGGDDGGMDFVDSAHRKPRLPPSPQRGDGSGGRNSYHASASSTSSAIMVDSGDSSVVRQLPNELTLLKSPVSQAQQQQQQQLLLLQGLSALKERGGGMRKNEENNYPPQAAVTGGGWADQKPKFPADDLDTRPPSSSPHIHPVKRALKRFGNEQHRLSQQQQASGKPDSDKTH
uniref:BZIP domain-containing protein n=1 Tax=Mesocestoides corti TaxID=53468 RepID=A0A5K3FWW7_MESCO